MGYMHIDNLYKNQSILDFPECYALEKIHGTSAHIKWHPNNLSFFSGGAKHADFEALFDQSQLRSALSDYIAVTIYGEAYGGKEQGMRATYGDALKFVVFDVRDEAMNRWLDVPDAHQFAIDIGLEFVAYERCYTTLDALNFERDRDSTQAKRNGILEPKMREGVVLRPINEITDARGNRIIIKHKRPEFSERKSIPEIDPLRAEKITGAQNIAEEWVTPMRLQHVLDKLEGIKDMALTGAVIHSMVDDVVREGGSDIPDDKDVRKAIGSEAAKLYRRFLYAQNL